jgi:ankyrin repeat protein
MLFIVSLLGLRAQSSHPLHPPVDVDLYGDHIKLLSPLEVIRAEDDPQPQGLTPIQRAMHSRDRIFDNMVSIDLDVIVNENGIVESAKPINGPRRFYDQAQAIEMRKEFAPIVKNGTIVRAHFTDSVRVLPPERWNSNSTPFPATPDLNTVSFALERAGCLGSCPSYKVSISGRGEVLFTTVDGYQGFVAVPGTHEWHIKQQAVADLLNEFHKARFLDALDKYQCNWTDLPSETITLTMNGITHSVVDYGGSAVGLPSSVEALEDRIDAIAGSARWVSGNGETVPALLAEKWNFAAGSKENITLFNMAISRGNADLVHMFVLAKAPIVTSDPRQAPICAASESGNVRLVEQLLAIQPPHSRIPPDVVDECLSRSARSGSLPLVELWLNRGAHPTPLPRARTPDAEDAREPASPLFNAVTSNNPEVVARLLSSHVDITSAHNNGRSLVSFVLRQMDADDSDKERHEAAVRIVHLLLDAGTDVNETDEDRAALYEVSDAPELVPDLIAAGAKINMRNNDGETPLMYASNETAVRALLAAGANPTVRSNDGKTAVDKMHLWSCQGCATLIEQAIAEQTGAERPAASR